MSRVHKLFLGHSVSTKKHRPAIKNQVYTILRIWRNYSHHDFGLERLIRLFLASAQFLSIGLYIKHFLSFSSSTMRKMALEVYVICKMFFPLLALRMGWTDHLWVLLLTIYFLIETIIYVTSLVFISDASRESVQPRRSLALLFFNFFEIVFDFAFIYSFFNNRIPDFFSRDLHGGVDAIYFSFVTASTVGFGDITPLANLAQKLTIAQISLTFIFVGLFLNYFANLLQRINHVETSIKFKKTRHAERRADNSKNVV